MKYSLDQLKEIAKKVEYQYHHNVGIVKLEEQLEAHCKDLATTLDSVAKDLGFLQGERQNEGLTPEDVTAKLDNKIINKLKGVTFQEVEGTQFKKEAEERVRNALRLVRCIVTCNNKNKTDYQGEIFTVQNAVLPAISKFIAFGKPYHIPEIMLNMIKEKQYQMFRVKKTEQGMKIKEPYMVPEYNIQILDPLSREELEAIKRKQLAEGFTGE